MEPEGRPCPELFNLAECLMQSRSGPLWIVRAEAALVGWCASLRELTVSVPLSQLSFVWTLTHVGHTTPVSMVEQAKEAMKQWSAKIAFASSPFRGSFWIFSFLADAMEDSFPRRTQALTWLPLSLQQLCILVLAPFLCSTVVAFVAATASWVVPRSWPWCSSA